MIHYVSSYTTWPEHFSPIPAHAGKSSLEVNHEADADPGARNNRRGNSPWNIDTGYVIGRYAKELPHAHGKKRAITTLRANGWVSDIGTSPSFHYFVSTYGVMPQHPSLRHWQLLVITSLLPLRAAAHFDWDKGSPFLP